MLENEQITNSVIVINFKFYGNFFKYLMLTIIARYDLS